MQRHVFAVLLAFSGLAFSGVSFAQDYPNKPVHFIVPNAPGTLVDVIARALGTEMAKTLGQPVVVENKPGADSVIGSEYVAKQVPADGYNVLVALVATSASLPLTVANLRFDPIKDLPPVIGLAEGRFILMANANAPFKTFNEMIDYAKANPAKLNFGSAVASVRLTIGAMLRAKGVDIVYVPYNGYMNVQAALMSGDVHVTLAAESNIPQIGDKGRVIATSGEQRLANYPNVPTFKELGFPLLRGLSYSLNVRAGTPKPIVDKLYSAAAAAMQTPAVKTLFQTTNMQVLGEAPEVATKSLMDSNRVYSEVAKAIGLTPQ